MSHIFRSIETDLKCLTNDQRSITVATLDQNLRISRSWKDGKYHRRIVFFFCSREMKIVSLCKWNIFTFYCELTLNDGRCGAG